MQMDFQANCVSVYSASDIDVTCRQLCREPYCDARIHETASVRRNSVKSIEIECVSGLTTDRVDEFRNCSESVQLNDIAIGEALSDDQPEQRLPQCSYDSSGQKTDTAMTGQVQLQPMQRVC